MFFFQLEIKFKDYINRNGCVASRLQKLEALGCDLFKNKMFKIIQSLTYKIKHYEATEA
jgi:hypothetical protein